MRQSFNHSSMRAHCSLVQTKVLAGSQCWGLVIHITSLPTVLPDFTGRVLFLEYGVNHFMCCICKHLLQFLHIPLKLPDMF